MEWNQNKTESKQSEHKMKLKLNKNVLGMEKNGTKQKRNIH